MPFFCGNCFNWSSMSPANCFVTKLSCNAGLDDRTISISKIKLVIPGGAAFPERHVMANVGAPAKPNHLSDKPSGKYIVRTTPDALGDGTTLKMAALKSSTAPSRDWNPN